MMFINGKTVKMERDRSDLENEVVVPSNNPLLYSHSMLNYFYPSGCIKTSFSPYQDYSEMYQALHHQDTFGDGIAFQQNPQDYYYYLQKSYEYFEANKEESQARCGFWGASVCDDSGLGSPGGGFRRQWGCKEISLGQECEVATHCDSTLDDNLDINSPCSDDFSGKIVIKYINVKCERRREIINKCYVTVIPTHNF